MSTRSAQTKDVVSKEDRHARLLALIEELGLSQGTLAIWLSLENTKQTRESVSRKVRGAVGVTPKDIAMLSLLARLKKDGYDLKSIEYSAEGDIVKFEHSLDQE